MNLFKNTNLVGFLTVFALLSYSFTAHSEVEIRSQFKLSAAVKSCEKVSNKGVDYFYLNTVDGLWVQYNSDGEGGDYGYFYSSGKNKLTLVWDGEYADELLSYILTSVCDSDAESTTTSPIVYNVKFNKNFTFATTKLKAKFSGYDYNFGVDRSGKLSYSGKGSVTEYEDE
jgi:hypothetical protein